MLRSLCPFGGTACAARCVLWGGASLNFYNEKINSFLSYLWFKTHFTKST